MRLFAELEKPKIAMEILMRASTFANGRVELVSESGVIIVCYETILILRNTLRTL